MYRKAANGWLKHLDFILLDLLCLQIAFVIAYLIRMGFRNPYADTRYFGLAAFLMLADSVVIFFYETFGGVLRRGYYKEFAKTVKHSFLVMVLAIVYFFTAKEGENYSRVILYLTWTFYMILSYSTRIGWKYYLKNQMPKGNKRALLLITSEKISATVVKNVLEHERGEYNLCGVVLVDTDRTGSNVCGVPVVASAETAASYVCREWVDEVLINTSAKAPCPTQLVENLRETGVTIHIKLAELSEREGKKQLIEKIGGYTVLTTSINYMTQKEAFMKRGLDIAGGLAGCILTGILFLFLAPAIYIASPGPILFSQIRVGKNGKQFKIYKFRSMYMDAEERKKELLEQNRVQDGMMFKMDFDPRIIGNRILPNGQKKTGLGDFIRRTSLDEFPQFFNVLKGDMSLVGTRPPTLDEWEKYELHHRARLAIKPGITGLWQVSGRSKITDFEEVVKLDTQYIHEWSMGMDLRILVKTVLSMVKRDGAM